MGTRGRLDPNGQAPRKVPLSLYPDYTVGPGITPGLLTLRHTATSARGLCVVTQLPPVGNRTPP